MNPAVELVTRSNLKKPAQVKRVARRGFIQMEVKGEMGYHRQLPLRRT